MTRLTFQPEGPGSQLLHVSGFQDSFIQGEGVRRDIKDLEDLSNVMMLSSLCGLGQAAPFVVTDTLKHFGDAYEQRIRGN